MRRIDRRQVQLRERVSFDSLMEIDCACKAGAVCRPGGREVQERMKKIPLLFLLLPFLTMAARAQESRQDFSFSVAGLFPPFISQNGVQQTPTYGLGGLASYRYMLTPRSAMEANYGYDQNSEKYFTSFQNIRVHTRMQEFSGAYVFGLNFKNWNPFIEAGPAGFLFQPLNDAGTTAIDAKQVMQIGAVYGGGVAWEISPSFDIRIEYRGLVMMTPDFGLAEEKVGRYYNVNNPVAGFAYHF